MLPQTDHAMGNLRLKMYRDASASPLTPSSTVSAYRRKHANYAMSLPSADATLEDTIHQTCRDGVSLSHENPGNLLGRTFSQV